jgi:predicted PurR-regulated permease PerM
MRMMSRSVDSVVTKITQSLLHFHSRRSFMIGGRTLLMMCLVSGGEMGAPPVQRARPMTDLSFTPTARLRSMAAALVAISVLAVAVAAAPLAGGLLGALVLGVALDAPRRALATRVGAAHAAAILLVVTLLLVFVPAVLVSREAVTQLASMNVSVSNPIPKEWIAPISPETIEGAKRAVGSSLTSVATFVTAGAAHGLLNLLVLLLCLYFVLLSGDTIWIQAKSYLPFSSGSSEQLGVHLSRVVKGTLLGSLLSAALQGASMAIGFAIAGLPGAALWGVVTGFASLVPLLGSTIVWLPAALLLLTRRDIVGAVAVVAFGSLLPTVIDRVTRATVSRRLGQVHPLVTLLGALIGIRLFGMTGLVAGPLLIELPLELLRLYRSDYGAGVMNVNGAVRPSFIPGTESVP